MMRYLGELIKWTFICGIALFFVFIFSDAGSSRDTPTLLILALLIFPFVVVFGAYYSAMDAEKKEFETKHQAALDKVQQAESRLNDAQEMLKQAEGKEELWKTTLLERTKGFPTLINTIERLEADLDGSLPNYLENKSHPAMKAAEIVREEGKRRRLAEKQVRYVLSMLELYEQLVPSLAEYREEGPSENEEWIFEEYSDEEKEDRVTEFLTKEEYRKLSPAQRNQMALDRFWKRPKSKWFIGRLYERYVGYLFETQGYDVNYFGIAEGKSDLGRDLICTKGKEVIVVQCKNWSKFKTLYEKHIFQFFGTVFEFRDRNPNALVRAMFFCTTHVSDLARRFAHELNIELVENHKFDQTYPCIKCNVSQITGTRIYHLPFDQQYDKVKITPSTGEMYCSKTIEAETAGYRRAFRWKGNHLT